MNELFILVFSALRAESTVSVTNIIIPYKQFIGLGILCVMFYCYYEKI